MLLIFRIKLQGNKNVFVIRYDIDVTHSSIEIFVNTTLNIQDTH